MQQGEYVMVLQQAHLLAQVVKDLNFADALAWAGRAEAVGPVMAPTAWMENRERLAEDIEVLRAAREFQRATTPKVKA